MKSSHASVAASLIIIISIAILAVLVVHTAPASTLHLKKLFTYRNGALAGRSVPSVNAKLDPQGRYLYVTDMENRFWITDWRKNKIVDAKNLSELPCEWYDSRDYKRADKPIYDWQFIPQTNWLFLGRCVSQLIVDLQTFQVIRKVIDPSRERGTVLFSPTGEFAIVIRIQRENERRSVEMRRVRTWELVAEWPSEVYPHAFTPDGKYVVELAIARNVASQSPPQASPEPSNCAMTFREVPSGKIAHRWHEQAGSGDQPCPGKPSFSVAKGSPYKLVFGQRTSAGKSAIFVWDAWTGAHLRTIQIEPYTLATDISLSPDGQYLVAGTWDDPQDNQVSADIAVWDLATGEMVYQTPRYKSRWGPNRVGSEVYPSFSLDGRHVVAVTPRGVDVYGITASE